MLILAIPQPNPSIKTLLKPITVGTDRLYAGDRHKNAVPFGYLVLVPGTSDQLELLRRRSSARCFLAAVIPSWIMRAAFLLPKLAASAFSMSGWI